MVIGSCATAQYITRRLRLGVGVSRVFKSNDAQHRFGGFFGTAHDCSTVSTVNLWLVGACGGLELGDLCGVFNDARQESSGCLIFSPSPA
jgi:hypothetical protein